jgi:translation elongation factor EF-Tu-like GTPase
VSDHEPHVEAELTFLTTEEGGRTQPAASGYFPTIFYDGRNWMARFTFLTDSGWAQLGETVVASVWLFSPEQQRVSLQPGMTFEVREGSQTVARGRILSWLA